jgi:hypothetical protein
VQDDYPVLIYALRGEARREMIGLILESADTSVENEFSLLLLL